MDITATAPSANGRMTASGDASRLGAGMPSGLTVTVTYTLSEAGRKASLIAGGDGRAHQRLTVQVPAARLHLVAVDANGIARLKLQPRFEMDGERVVRHDGPPVYDAPPTVEELFKAASRNYELERRYRTDRSLDRERRRDTERERRAEIATDFLADPAQRAMVHPSPTPTRCFIATDHGRLTFDATKESGPARDLPAEAYRRFRADLRARKERNRAVRTEQLALHDEKVHAIAAWVATHGSEDQRARHAAGVFPDEEAIAAMAEEAFGPAADHPRYPLDGAVRLQEHLRAVTGRQNITVAPVDLRIVGENAPSASACQWEVIRRLQTRLPSARVTLRAHHLSWRRDTTLPSLTLYGALVTVPIGPFIARREFAVPER
jgi:hypothetical protein